MQSVDTPCVKVCVIDAVTGLCQGCGRDIDEIARWAELDAEERRRIMAGLSERLHALGKLRVAI